MTRCFRFPRWSSIDYILPSYTLTLVSQCTLFSTSFQMNLGITLQTNISDILIYVYIRIHTYNLPWPQQITCIYTHIYIFVSILFAIFMLACLYGHYYSYYSLELQNNRFSISSIPPRFLSNFFCLCFIVI